MSAKRAIVMVGTGVVVGLGALAAVALLRPSPDATPTLHPDDAAIVAQGEAIYEAQCASCHGANLEGEANWRERGPDGRLPAPPHDETGHTWHHADAALFAVTKNGPPKQMGNGEPYYSNMPPYGDVLSDEEIIAVLSYIKSRWPADVRRQHDALNAQMAAAAKAAR